MHFHLNKISHLNPKSSVQEDRSQNEGIVKVPLKALLAKIDFRLSIIYEIANIPPFRGIVRRAKETGGTLKSPIQEDRSKNKGDETNLKS